MPTPTAVSMRLKFPEFVDVPDAQIEFALEEAALGVSTDWYARDVNLAQMYLAAHLIAVGLAASETLGGADRVQSETIGRMSVTYRAGGGSTATAGDYSSSTYGERYLALVNLNFPSVLII